MIKVLLVDDHKLMTDSVALVLNNSDVGIEVAGVAKNGQQALDKAKLLSPDVVLLDVILPDMNGVEVCEKILQQNPKTKVIGLTGSKNSNAGVKFKQLGASGFLHKESDSDVLIKAIRMVAEGYLYFLDDQYNELENSFSELSFQETQTVRHFLEGLKAKEIAEKMNVKDNTVRTYRGRAFKKLGIKTDVELAKLAAKFDF